MLSKLILGIPLGFPPLRRLFWKRAYQYLASAHPGCEWTFMNYGFVPENGQKLPLEPADEENRYCIQLYHYVATQVEIGGQDVLEVSSGRGGGASYIFRYLKPWSMTGIDFSPNAVEFCRRCHSAEGLSFQVGDAENLPFEGDSFDAVVNVEASHCYGSMSAFLGEVARVLRPGGHFLYTDFRSAEKMGNLDRELAGCPLELLQERDITENVLEALRRDSARKKALINRSAGPMLRHAIEEFAALEGTRLFRSLENRARIYKSYLLRKG